MIFRDKYGWPIERIKGRPFTNFMRILFQINIYQTLKRRRQKHEPT